MSQRARIDDYGEAYLDLEIRMKKHLKLEGRLALVTDIQHGLQAILTERHAVDKTKVVGPGSAGVRREFR